MNIHKNHKKIIVRLFSLDELGGIEEMYGNIPVQDVQVLIDEAEKLDLLCLSGIDTACDTYFNYAQSVEILEKELAALRSLGTTNTQLLEMIEKGAAFVKKEDGWTYFKVEKAS